MRRNGEVERLDAELALLARAETALRLRLGQALEVLGRGGHFELGFSSLAAYALERCDRSVRWVEAARCLARRLEELPELRRALAFGKVSWSMGELLARVARPEDEVGWLESAQSRTVRQMRALVQQVMAERAEAPARGDGEGDYASEGEGEGEEMCTLTCTVDHEEAWLFEATRALLGQLGTHGCSAQIEALLAEGQGTLLAGLPEGAIEVGGSEPKGSVERLRALGRSRAEAEACCEEHFRGSVLSSGKSPPVPGAVAVSAARGLASLESVSWNALDGSVRGLSRAAARHELELSRLVLRFHRADGWRQLGYASEVQYARERLGLSRSSMVARRALALRLEKLPDVAEALGAGQIGVEAALQVVRVANSSTQASWVARARQRTLKHLREEVAASLVAARLSGESDCPPPSDAEMVAFQALEQAVVSGRACQKRAANDGQSNPEVGVGGAAGVAGVRPDGVPSFVRPMEPTSEERRAWFVMLGSLGSWLEGGLQFSAVRGAAAEVRGAANAGRVTLRWRVSRATYHWWRGLEAQARRWLPRGMSWLKFLCLSLWQAWQHLFGGDVAYGQIYIRDCYRCTSPVCSRRDVTPHHLKFRSAGGSDAANNVAAVCTWCHLFGLHGGRIRAVGSAERIRWELGGAGRPCVVIDGRERVAA